MTYIGAKTIQRVPVIELLHTNDTMWINADIPNCLLYTSDPNRVDFKPTLSSSTGRCKMHNKNDRKKILLVLLSVVLSFCSL